MKPIRNFVFFYFLYYEQYDSKYSRRVKWAFYNIIVESRLNNHTYEIRQFSTHIVNIVTRSC